MQQPVLVIKLGSAVLTTAEGYIDEGVLKKLADEVATLSGQYRVVLVSSGAVSSGKAFFQKYKGTLVERKAAAAVGNPILIRLYAKYFDEHGITVAQALCERHHFSSRQQFVQLKETFTEFWNNGIIPIVNENDLVSNVELKFSDNDELATLIAIGFNAANLVICTSAGGFMDGEKRIVPQIDYINEEVLGFISKEKSSLGLGGMLSKITFTKLATSLGIPVIITGLKGGYSLQQSLAGKQGTIFKAQSSNLKARQKWLASGSITIGGLQVDAGAEAALHNRKSLLAVGIKQVQGSFAASEVVQLLNEGGEIFGVAKVRVSAAELKNDNGRLMAAHADDIVLF